MSQMAAPVVLVPHHNDRGTNVCRPLTDSSLVRTKIFYIKKDYVF